MGGHYQAKDAQENAKERLGEYAAEIRGMAHGVPTGGRDRDYSGYVLFYEELIERSNIAIRVFDFRGREGGGYILEANVFRREENTKEALADLLAFRHHMRWVKLRTGNLKRDVLSWGSDFNENLRG